MKNSNPLIFSLITILFLLIIYLFVSNNRRFERIESALAVESAKASFQQSNSFDSVYVNKDTVFFL